MKTLIILNGQPQGITEEELSIGDVVSLEESASQPLVVYFVQERPSKIGYSENTNNLTEEEDNKVIDIEWNDNYDKIAYLSYNEKVGAKYGKKTSQKLEKRMAKSLSGNTTVGSGAFKGHKGDVKSKEWLGEHKYTDSNSYRLQRTTWEKISREAFQTSRTPIFEVVLDQSATHLRLILMDLNDFGEKSHTTEEDLVRYFIFHQLKAKEGKESINLEREPLQSFINNILIQIDEVRVPAFLLTFDEHRSLIGLLAKDWETIFMPDEEPEPKRKPPVKTARPKVSRPKFPDQTKKVWPKRPFPQRKKNTNE